jgi:hypothetical protein
VISSWKRRHVLALASLGWYLMLAPVNPNRARAPWILTEAPLSKWTIKASTDSALECAEILKRSRQNNFTEIQKYTIVGKDAPSDLADEFMDLYYAQCISSEDPRLAK